MGEPRFKHHLRTKQACEPCRSRRRKCCGRMPCSQCVVRSYECEYAGTNRPGEPASANGPQKPASLQATDSNERLRDASTALVPEVPASAPSSAQLGQDQLGYSPLNKSHEPPEMEARSSHFKHAVDPVRGRFVSSHSSVVLPWRVGQSLGWMGHSVRAECYGWNLNTRPDQARAWLAPSLRRYLGHQDVCDYSRSFFEHVDQVYRFIDEHKFLRQVSHYWNAKNEIFDDFEAVICGVVALGSFFSEGCLSVERSLVEHAKQVLDFVGLVPTGHISANQVAGWVLRTLYLRLTTRPHVSWFASCATLHTAECIGLHMDLNKVHIMGGSTAVAIDCFISRQALLEIAIFLNTLISAEYGRSRVILQDAMEPNDPPTSKPATMTSIIHRLERSLTYSERLDVLVSLKSTVEDTPLFVLLKTDIAIYLFRKHLYPFQENISVPERDILLGIIQHSLLSAEALLPSRKPWWHLISTPFQSLMVLLALNCDSSLSLVGQALSVIRRVYDTFPSPLAGEVFRVAQTLVQGMEDSKTAQAQILKDALMTAGTDQNIPEGSRLPGEPGDLDGGALFEDWFTGNMPWVWPSMTNLGPQSLDTSRGPFDPTQDDAPQTRL